MKKILFLLLTIVVTACSNPNESGDQKQKVTNSNITKNSQQASISQQPKGVYYSYGPQQAMGLIQQKKNLLIIDVRSPQELKQGKIAGSHLVPFMDVVRSKHRIPKNQPLLVVCAVGGRSYGAMQVLARQGYKEIYNLKGGMDAWIKEKMPVVY